MRNAPPATASETAASAASSMPPSETSIVVALLSAPAAAFAVANASESIGPAAVTPKRKYPWRPPSCSVTPGPAASTRSTLMARLRSPDAAQCARACPEAVRRRSGVQDAGSRVCSAALRAALRPGNDRSAWRCSSQRLPLRDDLAAGGARVERGEARRVDRLERERIPDLDQKDRLALWCEHSLRRATDQIPAGGHREGRYQGQAAAEQDGIGRMRRPRFFPPRDLQRVRHAAEIAKARRESVHVDPVGRAGMQRDDALGRELGELGDAKEILGAFR